MEFSLLKIFSIFGAGFLASLSPCVYPMLPITIGYFGSQKSSFYKTKIFFYVLGQVIAFTALAIVSVKFGYSLGFSSQSYVINLLLGFLLLAFAVVAYSEKLPAFVNKLNSLTASMKSTNAFLSAFLLGVAAALIASPCTTPILSGVMLLIASSATLTSGVLLMLSYSLGFSLLLVVLALGIVNLNKLPKSGQWLDLVNKLSALLLVAFAAYYFYQATALYFEWL